MFIEVLIFGRNERLFHKIRNRLCRGEKPAFLGKFINDPTLTGINTADGGRRVLRQCFVAGQVPPVHPEDRPNGQGNHRDTHGHGGKNTAKERQDKSEHARHHQILG